MSPAEVVAIIGVTFVGIGLIGTWIRNGRVRSQNNGSLQTEIKNIKDKLDDENTGLGAIKKSVDEQKVHCALISTSYGERIKSLEDRKVG